MLHRNLLLAFASIITSPISPAFSHTKIVERERFMKDGVLLSVLQRVEDRREKECCLYFQNKNRGARGVQCKYLVEVETNDVPVLIEKSARANLYPRGGTWRAMGEKERYVKMTYFELCPVGMPPSTDGSARSTSSDKENTVSPEQALRQSSPIDK